ncbi:hypothetical protein ACE1MS_09485 [Lysinibacillus sp. fkY74-1]|uniref:hypothetical protein n=1 Tax=Lysinibacillus sphaericus TaxID=1421 RepID=UPI0018CF1FA0|nr:hypothetical protein [Lysinibacillus sphaericus]MBG9693669.1 hypothetical protein [Lysinibacillus sphaericus]MDM5350122.1 hypothetical protein [Lysinibacillus sphaericus]
MVKPIWIMPKGYRIEGQIIIPTNSKYQVQLTVEGNTTKPIAKDDDTMKFTSTTAKATVRDYIKQAVGKGLINKS